MAEAVNVAVAPEQTVCAVGCSEIPGPVFTVNVAAVVVAPPHVLVNTARYWFPFWPALVVKLSVVDVAPVMLLNVVPPLVLICHCTVGVGCPLAPAVNVAVSPLVTVWFNGFNVIAAAVFTVSSAGLVFDDPAVLVNAARYWFPFWPADVVKLRVVDVAPVMLLNVVPPLVLTCH